MKRFAVLVLIFFLCIAVYFFLQKDKNIHKALPTIPTISPSPFITTNPDNPTTTSVFLPYWESTSGAITIPNIKGLPQKPNSIVYFGIKPGSNGINYTEDGYLGLEQLNKSVNPQIDVLTVRMVDSDQNLAILRNTKQQKAIIDDTIDTAQKYGFKKVLIDFELSALPFQELTDQITVFLNTFSQQLKSHQISPALTTYGDNFYRIRPFDLAKLNTSFDSFYIMAYDLHKTQGEPGPNFPLHGSQKYGTDIQTAMNKFLQVIPKEKIVVTFGMYGYDWAVDEFKRPIGTAKAKSLQDMKQEFLSSCSWKNCLVTRDTESEETEVDYIDNNLVYHIAWFEDETSVEKKIEYLKTVGITHYSFWVWGYY